MSTAMAMAFGISVGSLILAGMGWGIAARMRQKIDALESLLGSAETRIGEIETQFKSLRPRVDALCDQADRLAMRQTRLDSLAASNGFAQAKEMTRHGAGAAEIISTCGLNGGEASLIETLYGCEGTDR